MLFPIIRALRPPEQRLKGAPELLVPAAVGVVRVAPFKVVWLWAHLVAVVAALGLLCRSGVAGGALLAAVGLTHLTLCLGHSVGLHRGLIHETYVMPRALARVLVTLFVFTGLGGPLSWIRLHRVRDYWQNRADCPRYFAYRHSLLRDLFWNLHCAFEPVAWERYGLSGRLERDGYLRFLERTWWMWNLVLFFAFAALFGWRIALVLGPARVAGSVLGHWFIGFWTHKHGSRRYRIAGASEEGTNSLVLGWISFGEGFHNNHHAVPDSARMGVKRWELDIGWLSIRMLEALGWVRDVKSWCRDNVELVRSTSRPQPVRGSDETAARARGPDRQAARCCREGVLTA